MRLSLAERSIQQSLFGSADPPPPLLKWIGSKNRYASEITSNFPQTFGKYIEPFLGGGSVLGAMAPAEGIAGDALGPLIDIWKSVQSDPSSLLDSYRIAWESFQADREGTFARIKESYNNRPNSADLLFISRSCYGGILRFTRKGTISTPVGPHNPISADTLEKRMAIWKSRIAGVVFFQQDFAETMAMARSGDVVYCDPPYSHTQSILYGSQDFLLGRLCEAIGSCKKRGVHVALSIDGTKKSGSFEAQLSLPDGLFEREIMICCGRSMLRRFQRKGETLEDEVVHDRLLLTW